MNAVSRCGMFTFVYAIAYTLCYVFDLSLFQYYPLVGEIHRTPQPPSAGVPMMWYGWIASALLIALIVVLVVPPRWSERLPSGGAWSATAGALLYVLIYERHWFFAP